jgi:hypothetical protein
VKPEDTATARQSYCKCMSMATDMHTTIEELLEMVFICGPCQDYIVRMNEAAEQLPESLDSKILSRDLWDLEPTSVVAGQQQFM